MHIDTKVVAKFTGWLLFAGDFFSGGRRYFVVSCYFCRRRNDFLFCTPDASNLATFPDLVNAGYRHWNEAGRLVEIAEELEARSRLAQARLFLERALALAPEEFPGAYCILAFTYFRDNSNRAEDGENALMDGIEATGSDVVKAWYAAMLEEDDLAGTLLAEVRRNDDLAVQFALGAALHWRGLIDESLAIYRSAVRRLAPGETPDALNSYCSSMIWMRGQGFDIDMEAEVFPYIRALVGKHPERYTYRALTVMACQVLRDWEGVRRAALETLAVVPDEETTMLALAIALNNLQQPDAAAMWLNRAIGAKPSFARARAVLAGIYEQLGKPELASAVAREIPAANPGYAVGKLQAADVLRRIGNTTEAVALFREGYAALKPYEKGMIPAQFGELAELAGL